MFISLLISLALVRCELIKEKIVNHFKGKFWRAMSYLGERFYCSIKFSDEILKMFFPSK